MIRVIWYIWFFCRVTAIEDVFSTTYTLNWAALKSRLINQNRTKRFSFSFLGRSKHPLELYYIYIYIFTNLLVCDKTSRWKSNYLSICSDNIWLRKPLYEKRKLINCKQSHWILILWRRCIVLKGSFAKYHH